jgi:hypothetical protein
MTFFVFLAVAGPLPAQEPPPRRGVNRPEELEVVRRKTAYTLPADVAEVDVVFFSGALELDDDEELDIARLSGEIAFGITDWLTGEVEVPFLAVDPDPGDRESGLGDVVLELKGAVSPDLVPFPLALGLRATLTTGDEDRGLGGNNSAFIPFAAAAWTFDGMTLHAEIFARAEEDRRTVYGANVAVDVVPWGPEVSLLAGLNLQREVGESVQASLVPAAEYRWGERGFRFGAGIPIGLTDEGEDWGILLNFQASL